MTGLVPTVPTMECPRCQVDVPAGRFCGLCGCQDAHPRMLRAGTFGAEPGEHVLRPFIVSSLFPQLPTRSRTPFRITLVAAAAGLLLSVILKFPALGIPVSALSLPLLFLLYLRASATDRDCRPAVLIFASTSGALLGAAWIVLSGQLVARTYGVPMSVGLAMHQVFREGLLIPVVGIVLMIVPTVIVRLSRPRSRESLDGFVIGALSGLTFSAVATLVRLAPQVSAGVIAHSRPIQGLVVEVLLCAVIIPVTAAASGGMVGIALWFRPHGGGAGHYGRVRPILVLIAITALLAHAATAVVDIAGRSAFFMLIAHLGGAVLILLLLRVSMQLALLHEATDPIAEDQPMLCLRCEMVVPDMAFCPSCGAATRAASQQSRSERRGSLRPVPAAAGTSAPEAADGTPEHLYPGYALPAQNYAAPAVQRPRLTWLLSRWGTVITVATVVLAGVAVVLSPKVVHYMCPPECGKPPTGTPVMALPRYTSADGAFSVSYPAPGSAYTVETSSTGVTATYTGGDGGVMQLFAEPADGRPPRDIIRAVVARTYPDAKVAYEIPNAMVGYQPGYGEVADTWPQSSTASYRRIRILVLAAVKNDLALVAFATGPYHAFGPDFGPGPPSGANLEIALDMGKYVNSFHWSGDPAR